jgi:hypothetical protein
VKAVFLGIALVVCVALLGWGQFAPKPSTVGQGPLDLLPVTDPLMYRPENLRRFKLNDTEYCAPRIESLVVFVPKTTGVPLGASVMLNPDTLTNFNQRPYRDGKPNPDWRDGMTIGISPTKEGWGYPATLKSDIGKSLEEATDADFSSLGDLAKAIALTRDDARTDLRTRVTLVRLHGVIVRLSWSPAGLVHLVFPISDQAKGSLNVTSPYVERLESLFEVARNFFRLCDAIQPVPN